MIYPDIKDIMLPGKVKRFLLVHPAFLEKNLSYAGYQQSLISF